MRADCRVGRRGLVLSWIVFSSLALPAAAAPAAPPPQAFEENLGQAPPSVRFLSRADGMLLQLDADGIDITVDGPGGEGSSHARLSFRGAPPSARIAGIEALPGTVTSIAGSDPRAWISGIPTFAAVRYRGVYPDVDLSVRGDHRRLTLEFIPGPGADASSIDPALEGADAGGALRLRRSGAPQRVTFVLDRVPQAPPVRSQEVARVVVDGGGNTFLAGRTLGPHGAEAFVARVDRDAAVPAFVTYFGGSGRDVPLALALAPDGGIVVAGRTESDDFPIAGPAAPAKKAGPSDGFVLKLAADGSTPVDSRLVGGDGEDEIRAIAVDSVGVTWIGGVTARAAGEPASGFLASVPADGGGMQVVPLAENGVASVEAIAAGGADGTLVLAGSRVAPGGTSRGGGPMPQPFVATLDAHGTFAWTGIDITGGGIPTGFARDPSTGALTVVGRRGVAPASGGIETGFVALLDSPSAAPTVRELDAVPLAVIAAADGQAFIAGARSSQGPEARRGPVVAFIARVSTLDATIDSLRAVKGASMVRATGLAVDPDGRPVLAGIETPDEAGTERSGARLLAAASSVGWVSARPLPVLAAGCPGTIQFDNSAGTGLWQTAANWSTNVLPSASDDVCIPAGMTVQLTSGTHSISTLFVASGGGLTISAGTLSIANASQVDGSFTLSGGTLGGAGAIGFSTLLTWTGGVMSGPGATNANAGMAIGGAADKDLISSRVLNTFGTVTWTDNGPIRLMGPSQIVNFGTWDAQNNASIVTLSGSPNFSNLAGALFRKSAGTGFTSILVPLDNAGTLTVDSGTLAPGGGTLRGTINGSGATSELFLGNGNTFDSTSIVNVPNLTVNSSVMVNGLLTVTGRLWVRQFFTCTINPAATVAGIGFLDVWGTLALNSGDPVPVTTMNVQNSAASVLSTDPLTVSGTFTWGGGTLSGAGSTTVNGPLQMTTTFASTRTLSNGHVLNTNGTTTQTNGNLSMGTGSIVHNTGAWQGRIGVSGGMFDNKPGASVTHDAGVGVTGSIGPLNNAGTVTNVKGTFTLGGGPLSTLGVVNSLPGGTLILAAYLEPGGVLNASNVQIAGWVEIRGSYTASSTAVLNADSGRLRCMPGAVVNLGATNVVGEVTLNTGSTADLPSLVLAGGLLGSDVVNVSGTTTWTGGTIYSGPPLNALGGVVIYGAATKSLQRTLNTPSFNTWAETGAINLAPGALINNSGTWWAQSDAPMTGTGRFDNLAGALFRKNAGTGTTQIGAPFDNHGTVEVATGTLSLSGGGTGAGPFTGNASSTLVVGGGTYTMTPESSVSFPNLDIKSGTLNVHGPFSVTSSAVVEGGALVLHPDANVLGLGSSLTVQAGTLDLKGGEPLATSLFVMTGGTLKGTDTLAVSTSMNWWGGTLDEAGVIHADGEAIVTGPNPKNLTGGRTLETAGATSWTDQGSVNLGGGASIRNSGTWTARTDAPLNNLGGGALFDNQAGATFDRADGIQALQVGPAFTNAGLVKIQNGTMAFSGGYTQTAGALSLEGGAVASSTALAVQGGLLTGVGNAGANVAMGGHLAPGLMTVTGALTIDGALSAAASAVYDVEIRSLAAYDSASFTGPVALAGTLHVTLLSGFVPADHDTFTILTFPSATGTFAAIDAPALPGGRAWHVVYNPASVVLEVLADLDGDGVGNLVDCAPSDATAWSVPAEVSGVAFATDDLTLSWDGLAAQAGPATTYDVMRGSLAELPVGGGAAEACLAIDGAATQLDDTASPGVGEGFYYLVRGGSVCGTGTYGTTSGGAPRNTAICP